jgi:acetoin utilization deacetylase AcuC-like enzyme
MDVALYTHRDMLDHRPGLGHPERPERLSAVLGALADASDLSLTERSAPLVTRAQLAALHPAAYLDEIEQVEPGRNAVQIDPDTWMSAGSLTAARRAAGAVLEAVRATAAGEVDRSFCAVRPPGHHAEPEGSMGFCIFSNVALGAQAARAAGFQRVAVVDFDVHHGNGTQAALAGQDGLFFASIQQWPMWPGTGHPSQPTPANIANAVVAAGAPATAWRKGFDGLMTRVDDFRPDLILVSAGFDAHQRDPLGGGGGQDLDEDDFAWATRAILETARRHAAGRVISSLEGGYDLQALGQSALAHVRALSET